MPIYSNKNDFLNAVHKSGPNATVELKPGVYDGELKLDYRGSNLNVVLNGVTLNSPGNDGLYTLDVTGENISITADELKINGGKMGGIGVRGHNLKLFSDLKGYVTGVGIGIFVQGTNHHIQGFNVDGVRSTGLSGHGFPVNNNRGYSRGFAYSPARNWRITQCIFQNIAPEHPGDAGGGVRLIPHVKGVMVDNCLFKDIKGSGLWGDHNQKEIEFYYNTFDNIEYKAIFLEICDPDPNDKSGFVAKIAGNVFLDTIQKHSILIAASSGQNPSGIEVWGNKVYGGWGIIAGAMERRFARRFDKSKPDEWEWIDARLENINIHHNLIKPTTGRNHGAMYNGPLSGLIEWNNNYYATGHQYNWDKPNAGIETAIIDKGKIFVGGDKMNVHGIPDQEVDFYDKNAVIGPMPSEFPFPEVMNSIPVDKVDISGGTVDIPVDDPIIDDPVIDDPVVDPPQSNSLPDVWVFSDFSEGDTDADDWCAMAALLLTYFGKLNLIGITVGCYPTIARDVQYKYDSPLECFEDTLLKAYRQEVGKPDFKYLNADSWRKKFDKDIATESIDKVIQVISESDKPLYLLNWGILTEIAVLVQKLENEYPDLLNKIVIRSHFTASVTDNNYRKDSLAAQYLKELAKNGVIKFDECSRSGADLIDDKTFPKMSEAVLQSKIGVYFHEKWQNNKPDFSDFITVCVTAFPELGFTSEFQEKIKHDGTSSLTLIKQYWKGKQALYDIIEAQAEKAVNGELGEGVIIDDPVIDDPVVNDPPVSQLAQRLSNEITDLDGLIEDLKITSEKLKGILQEMT